MSAGKEARGGKGDGVVVNDHFDLSRKGMKSRRANDSASVAFVDCHMWLGAEETSAIDFHRVKDGGFVRAEDLGIPVRYA